MFGFILRQSYQNLEIILVDDGVVEGIVDVCKRYIIQDPRVSIIVNTGKGVHSEQNVGARSSRCLNVI